jgi:hypothetical protein
MLARIGHYAARRFPPPWSVEDFEIRLCQPLSERQRKGAVFFSLSLHFLAKKNSAKKLSRLA